jgi:hypothetical protein
MVVELDALFILHTFVDAWQTNVTTLMVVLPCPRDMGTTHFQN